MSWATLIPMLIQEAAKIGIDYYNSSGTTATAERALTEGTKNPKKIKVVVMAELDVEAETLEDAAEKIRALASSAGILIHEVEECL
jgi:hypothetical protein